MKDLINIVIFLQWNAVKEDMHEHMEEELDDALEALWKIWQCKIEVSLNLFYLTHLIAAGEAKDNAELFVLLFSVKKEQEQKKVEEKYEWAMVCGLKRKVTSSQYEWAMVCGLKRKLDLKPFLYFAQGVYCIDDDDNKFNVSCTTILV
ncbi:hypothetical protein Tco_1048361 [Tanacetum coccineum]